MILLRKHHLLMNLRPPSHSAILLKKERKKKNHPWFHRKLIPRKFIVNELIWKQEKNNNYHKLLDYSHPTSKEKCDALMWMLMRKGAYRTTRKSENGTDSLATNLHFKNSKFPRTHIWNVDWGRKNPMKQQDPSLVLQEIHSLLLQCTHKY